jgi:CheY-like chemotaxis protein
MGDQQNRASACSAARRGEEMKLFRTVSAVVSQTEAVFWRKAWTKIGYRKMKITTPDERAALEKLTVLVLEDEMMVAMLLEDMLSELGCRVVGPVATVATALKCLEERAVDAALLDVNLSFGQSGYRVADAMVARRIPFAFVTGYGAGSLNGDYRDHPTLQKPFHMAALVETLVGMARAKVVP